MFLICLPLFISHRNLQNILITIIESKSPNTVQWIINIKVLLKIVRSAFKQGTRQDQGNTNNPQQIQILQ